MPTPTIHAIIKDKNGIIAEDNFTAVSSYNEVGLFDVLPMHTNFISLIRNKIVTHKGTESKEIKVGTGLLQVVGSQIHIFLGLPEPADKTVIEAAEKIAAKPLTINHPR